MDFELWDGLGCDGDLAFGDCNFIESNQGKMVARDEAWWPQIAKSEWKMDLFFAESNCRRARLFAVFIHQIPLASASFGYSAVKWHCRAEGRLADAFESESNIIIIKYLKYSPQPNNERL